MQKNILYIHNTSIDSKTANLTQVISMCNAFSEEGLSVKLLLPSNRQKKDEDFGIIKKHFSVGEQVCLECFKNPFKSYKVNKNFNFISLFFYLLKNKENKESIVFVRSVHYLLVSILLGYNTIYESHNFLVHQGNKYINNLLKSILKLSFKSKRALLFIGISENLSNYWIEQGIPAHQVLTAHDGFSPILYPNYVDKVNLKKQLGLGEGVFNVIYTGNIHLNRGVNYIIECAKRIPEMNFYIIGGPDHMIEYYNKQYQAGDFKNLFFRGQVKHQEAINYQLAADLLLGVWSKDVPTINYCSPLKLFEYMATGNPILAFDYPTIKEVISDNENGYLCKADDIDDMVIRLQKIKDDVNNFTVAKKAKKDAYDLYTWNKRVTQILNRLNV